MIFFSPVLMVIVAVIAVILAELKHLPKPGVGYLASLTIILAMVGLGGSLLCTIGWAIWYEQTKHLNAGNAPLAWIFFYGPVSTALGQLIALILWWFKKSE